MLLAAQQQSRPIRPSRPAASSNRRRPAAPATSRSCDLLWTDDTTLMTLYLLTFGTPAARGRSLAHWRFLGLADACWTR